MGLFSLTKEISIDLGTANTLIIHNDKIVIDEPSIVALDSITGKLIAVGKEARQMQGKEPAGIRTVRPLRKGVIADFNAVTHFLRFFLALQMYLLEFPSFFWYFFVSPLSKYSFPRPQTTSTPAKSPKSLNLYPAVKLTEFFAVFVM